GDRRQTGILSPRRGEPGHSPGKHRDRPAGQSARRAVGVGTILALRRRRRGAGLARQPRRTCFSPAATRGRDGRQPGIFAAAGRLPRGTVLGRSAALGGSETSGGGEWWSGEW